MQKSEAVLVAIRMMALWMLVTGLTYLPSQLFLVSAILRDGGDAMMRSSTWAGVAYQVILMFTGVMFWLFAGALCNYILGGINDGQISLLVADSDELQVLAFTILGIILSVTAFANLLQTAAVLLYAQLNDATQPWVQHDRGGFDPRSFYGPILSFSVRLFIGVWLVLRPRHVARLLDALREKLEVRA